MLLVVAIVFHVEPPVTIRSICMDNNVPLPKSVLGVQVNVGWACAFGVPLKLVGALAGDTV